MFHRIALTAAAALSVAGPALAGGFTPVVVTPPPATPVVPVAPVIVTNDWSGPYAGAQLGFGRSTVEDTLDELEDLEDEGALFGVHAGYMFDFGGFVAGAELDYDRTQITLGENGAEDGVIDVDDVVDLDSIARAKLRLGFDAGRLLPYVTAGLARASLSAEFVDVEDSYDGRFMGLGASYMVSDRVMVGVEGLRHNFEDMPSEASDTQVDTLTLRGSFRF